MGSPVAGGNLLHKERRGQLLTGKRAESSGGSATPTGDGGGRGARSFNGKERGSSRCWDLALVRVCRVSASERRIKKEGVTGTMGSRTGRWALDALV